MGEFPGRNSILVMDNAPVHHGGCIAELCDNAGVLLVYLPAYSPNMNPIEKVFSVLKSRLKREMLLTGTDEDPDIIKDFLPEFVNKDLMAALFRGSGY
jgi:transposase